MKKEKKNMCLISFFGNRIGCKIHISSEKAMTIPGNFSIIKKKGFNEIEYNPAPVERIFSF